MKPFFFLNKNTIHFQKKKNIYIYIYIKQNKEIDI